MSKQRPPADPKSGMCVHCGKPKASIAYTKQGTQQLWIHTKCKELRRVIPLSLIEIDEALTVRLKSAYTPEALKELTDSIYKDGLFNPLGVVKIKGRNAYTLVAGLRRYHALKNLNVESVMVVLLQGPPKFNISA